MGLIGLSPEDVFVECLVGAELPINEQVERSIYRFEPGARTDSGETIFTLEVQPPLSGLQEYRIRLYPHHRLLSRRFELGCMLWL